MDTPLAAYLPQDRQRALALGEDLPEHTTGGALFADISGFTPLTEALDRALGARRGAEALVQQINQVYDRLIAQVERFGGSVISFAGDSMTCWFDEQRSNVQTFERANVELRADLDALARLDLTPLDTPEPELTYLFKHIVTQEVTYESLTAQARAGLHEQLAAYREQVAGDDTDRFVDLLAYHYNRSDNLPKKRHFVRRAGMAAAARFANDAAVDYLSRALLLTPKDDPAERYALLLEREKIYDLQGARAEQARDLAALEALAELLNDKGRRAAVAVRRSNYAYWTGDSVATIAATAEAVALAQAANQTALAAEAYWRWSWALIFQGDLAAAHVKATTGLDLARNQNNPAEARSWYEQGLDRARAASNQLQEGVGLWGLGNVALDSGELDMAAEMYHAAVAAFEAGGHGARVIEAIAGLAAVALARRDLVEAQVHAEMIVDYLTHGALSTENTEEPLRVELICDQVLHTLGDPRATGVLESAHQRLQARAAKIPDVRLRHSFLENVPYHREIVAAWAEAHNAR